jgi:hypothetical protein
MHPIAGSKIEFRIMGLVRLPFVATAAGIAIMCLTSDVAVCAAEDAAVAAVEALPAGDTADSRDLDVNEIAAAATLAAAAEPVLVGGLLDVENDPMPMADGRRGLLFSRVLAAGRETEQRAAMDRIIRAIVPAGQWRVDAAADRVFPYTEIASRMGEIIRTDVRFPGCEFLGGSLRVNPTSESLEFLPRFRVARDGQFDKLCEECRGLLGRRPDWAKVLVRDDAEGQKVLKPESPEPDVNELFAELQKATRQNAALYGAAIDVEVDNQGHPDIAPKIYRFTRTLDGRRAGELSTAIETLTRRLVPSGRISFNTADERQLPVSELLDRLQQAIDIEPRFAGCWVSHVTLAHNAEDGGIDVALHGRVWRPAQSELLADYARRLMQQDAAWQVASAKLQTANREDLVVVPESPDIAARYYGEAMHHFYARDYEAADKLLALASIEDPRNILYRYWRVIGKLAGGDQPAAEDRLQQTVQGFGIRPNSREHVAVMRAIYRIQGPLRHELMAMERRVMTMGTLANSLPK